MSKNHKNYNKMYDNDKNPTVKDETSIEAVNAVEVSEHITKQESEIIKPEDVIASKKEPETAVEPAKPKIYKAVVCNCTKLNVRERPSSLANVLVTINANDEVIVDEDQPTGKFYSITTASGIKGYCMKEYLKMK